MLKPVKGNIIFNKELLNRKSIGYLPQISTGDMNYPVTVTDIILSGLMIQQRNHFRNVFSRQEKSRKVIDELGLTGMAGHPERIVGWTDPEGFSGTGNYWRSEVTST